MISTAVMLQLVEECATNVVVLTEDIQPQELARSRLTRQAVVEQLLDLAQALAALHDTLRHQMPELDWDGWRLTADALARAGTTPDDDVLWFAVHSLVPATLMWLRVYRTAQPEWFACKV